MVDPVALVTCGDVYAVTSRRLEHTRRSGKGDTSEAAHLASSKKRVPELGRAITARFSRSYLGPVAETSIEMRRRRSEPQIRTLTESRSVCVSWP
jgi:hypothetical protein